MLKNQRVCLTILVLKNSPSWKMKIFWAKESLIGLFSTNQIERVCFPQFLCGNHHVILSFGIQMCIINLFWMSVARCDQMLKYVIESQQHPPLRIISKLFLVLYTESFQIQFNWVLDWVFLITRILIVLRVPEYVLLWQKRLQLT